jgi:hypothetical protein
MATTHDESPKYGSNRGQEKPKEIPVGYRRKVMERLKA